MKGEMKNLRVIAWWGPALVKHWREDQDRRFVVTFEQWPLVDVGTSPGFLRPINVELYSR